MRFRAVVRRNWEFFSLCLAIAGLFIPLFAFMFYSSYSFWLASLYTGLVILLLFVLMVGIPTFIYESMRRLAAWLCKQGLADHRRKSRENRFG